VVYEAYLGTRKIRALAGIFSRKESGLSMLSKSKASPYKLTLMLSFILSD